MKEGIYHVTFSSNNNAIGEGIAVIKGGAVNGGDSGYLYTGVLEKSSGGFKSSLRIHQWDQSAVSIFGPLREFQLQLSVSESAAGFTAEGSIAGQPHARIAIQGRYLAVAA